MSATRSFIVGSLFMIVVATTLAVVHSQEVTSVATAEDRAEFKRLNDLYKTIEKEFYTDVPVKNLFSSALNGMLQQLDPHSAFVDVSDYGQMDEQYRGNYQGIGVSFISIDGKITVMEVMEGGPSAAAGLKMGDQIVEIEGEPSLNLDADAVQNRLRGPGGTKVKVGIERPGQKDLFRTTITRGSIPIKSVDNVMMLDEQTGYARIVRFARPTGAELEMAMQGLKKQGMKQFILDLRGNGGGLLPTAIELTDKFLSGQRLIVYTDGKNPESHETYYSSRNGNSWDLPLVILVDHFSASASEIVSGALQDWDRAVVVGETTFGKGLVQSGFLLSDGSRLLLTTSHYFTPTGRLIQRPYKGLDLETYQIQGIEGYEEDELLESPEFDQSRPSYRTPSGRLVYGGGGITPDEVVKSGLLFDPFVYALNNQYVTFFFGRNHYWKHPDPGMDFDTYLQKYTVSDVMLEELLAVAREREFEYYPRRGEKLSDAQVEQKFREVREDLKIFLKAELAQFYYGRPTGFTIRALARDKQLARAREMFDRATELAQRSGSIDPKYFANKITARDGNR